MDVPASFIYANYYSLSRPVNGPLFVLILTLGGGLS
jgi:hypothetical protein